MRHFEVQDDQVRGVLRDSMQKLFSRLKRPYMMSRFGEALLQCCPKGRLVIDQENANLHRVRLPL